MTPVYINKYLEKFKHDNWKLQYNSSNKYRAVVVVPSLDEYDNLKTMLRSLSKNDEELLRQTLVIVVVNNVVDSGENVKINNKKTIDYLSNILKMKKQDDVIINELINSSLNIAIVDMASEGNEMPVKEGGVGLARKTGMDLALTVFDYENYNKRIIICLDADCEVSENYFREIIDNFEKKKLFAGYVNYEHPLGENQNNRLAIVCYELFLRYYVLGLTYANSPYAIHTIGSTMVCSDEAYVSIQGMNKRKAAEDFYFMEKLAKKYNIQKIPDATVYPSGRGSWRVPFGTGQRVNRFLAKEMNEYQLYSPESFRVLKDWNEVFLNDKIQSAEYYIESAEKIHPELAKFLILNSFNKNWKNILDNSNKLSQINRQKMFWFDGFKTLKLIHYLRDNVYANVNMFDALDKMISNFNLSSPIKRHAGDIPNIKDQIKYLSVLREIA